jgi:hypothetical protein
VLLHLRVRRFQTALPLFESASHANRPILAESLLFERLPHVQRPEQEDEGDRDAGFLYL